MGLAPKTHEPLGVESRTALKLVLFLCWLNLSALLDPAAGFTLKTCRITFDDALCVKKNLKAVPQDVPSTVKRFDLSGNRLTGIQVSDFQNVPLLTQLDLNRNYIDRIDDGAFAGLTFLKKLNLNNNNLKSLRPDLFTGLSNLTELFINKNYISAVASNTFSSTPSLELLDISHNKLNHITKVRTILQHLPRLKKLFINGNGLTTFHSWELTNTLLRVQYLDLSENPITVFRITADIFPNLTWLNVGKTTKWKQMKWDVNNQTFLSRVSTLDVSGLQMAFEDMRTLLQTVNTSLSTLRMNAMKHSLRALINISCTIPTMSSLELRGNKLTSIPSDMFNGCVNVTELDLTGNLIHRIHDGAFRSLPSLRILSLGRNKLSSVPVALRDLPGLQELDLNTNKKFRKLGCGDFSNNKNLRQLSLFKNSISSLSECVFKDLVRLQVLKLQTNHLSKLNGTFKNTLPNLKQLRLNGNKLKSINHGEFKGLQSLQNLSLHDNQIKLLVKGCFVGLTNLTEILLQANFINEREVNKGVFQDLINLRRLDLRDNSIKFSDKSPLRQPPFSKLSRLETLAMPSQRSKAKSHLPPNLLQGLTNLLFFNARHIKLFSMHKDMFEHTPRLQTLDISSNELSHLSPELFSPIQKLKNLYISRTNLGSLDFLIDANLTQLKFLQAKKNQYSVIRREVIMSIPSVIYADFEGNSFTCDCDNAWFIKEVNNNNKTQYFDAHNFVCNYPPHLIRKKLLDLDVHSCLIDIEFICFVSSTCLVLLFMAVSFTYNFLRRHLVYAYYLFLAWLVERKQRNTQVHNQYDAFISYNVHDELWVITEMVPKLEKEQGWRLCLHHRDFEPGKSIIDNITDAIYRSRKTICVISRKYLESEWCSREIQVASFRLFDEKKDVLILIFLEEIPTFELSPYYSMRKMLKKKTYLSRPPAGEHIGLFWEKLRQALKTGGDLGEDGFRLTVMDRQCSLDV